MNPYIRDRAQAIVLACEEMTGGMPELDARYRPAKEIADMEPVPTDHEIMFFKRRGVFGNGGRGDG